MAELDLGISQSLPAHRARARNRLLRRTGIAVGAGLALLVVTVLAALPFIAMPAMGMDGAVTFGTVYTPSDFGVTARDVTLETADGLRLKAWYVAANADIDTEMTFPRAQVVIFSGIQNPSVTAFFPHAAWLGDNGYATLLVETRGHRPSEGTLGLGMGEVEDAAAALAFLEAESPGTRNVLFGLSMGAAGAVTSFGELQGYDALVSLSSYSSWPDVFAENMADMLGLPQWLCNAEKPFMWLYLGFTHGFDKLPRNPLAEIQKANGRPVLLMHSLEDSQVPYADFERLSAAYPKADIFLRSGDHHFIVEDDLFFTPAEDSAYADAILEFLGQVVND